MVRSILMTGLAVGGMVLLAQDDLRTSPDLAPVQTIVTVEARHGKDVPLLTRDDVAAYERRDRLQVTDVVPLQGQNADLDLFLLVDDASSWTLGSQLGDLRQFIETLPAATAVGIGYMRNGTFDTVQNLTAGHGRAAQALRLPMSSASIMASPYLSLSDLIKRWPGNSPRREVILATSGIDPLGGMGQIDPYLDAAIEDAQRAGIIVYAIYMPAAGHAGHSFWSSNWAQSHLAQIAEETGSEAYMLGLGAPVAFAPYLADIAAHLAHQYRVGVLVKAENKPGLREIKFATEAPNAELVAGAKLYVPARNGAPGK
jgi:hypothetical protein